MNKLTIDIKQGIYQNALDILLTTGDLTFADVGYLAHAYKVRVQDTCQFLERVKLLYRGGTEYILSQCSGAQLKRLGVKKYAEL